MLRMRTIWWKSNNPHRYGTTGTSSTVLGWSESSNAGKAITGTTNFQSRGAVFQLPNENTTEHGASNM